MESGKKDNIQLIYQGLFGILRSILEEEGISSQDFLDFPDLKFGDFTTNILFKISSLRKKSPQDCFPEIKEKIEAQLSHKGLREQIERMEFVQPGYINFFLHKKNFSDTVCRLADKVQDLDVGNRQSVIIEFVSANPTGPLTVAHGRQAAVGDSLARVLKFLGFNVHTQYYLNDEGKQIDLLGQSLKIRLQECEGKKDVAFPEGGYKGDYLKAIAQEMSDRGITSSKEDAFFTEYAINTIRREIEEELRDFGVEFDIWISQKDITGGGYIDEVLKILKEKKCVYSKEGAVWLKSTDFGDDKDRVIVKSDSSYTYLAPDIAYHYLKFQENPSLVVNLWGPDHHGYINRLRAAVEALGFESSRLNVIIVQHVSLIKESEKISMSTRQGTFIALRQLLQDPGRDATRFFYILRKVTSPLEFDVDLAHKKSKENPVYYIQYAYARIKSIFRKVPPEELSKVEEGNFIFDEKEEEDLARFIVRFPYVVQLCGKMLDPYFLADYLMNLANLFHMFYERCRIIGQEHHVFSRRVILALAVKNVLEKGLGLLGVSSPERM